MGKYSKGEGKRERKREREREREREEGGFTKLGREKEIELMFRRFVCVCVCLFAQIL